MSGHKGLLGFLVVLLSVACSRQPEQSDRWRLFEATFKLSPGAQAPQSRVSPPPTACEVAARRVKDAGLHAAAARHDRAVETLAEALLSCPQDDFQRQTRPALVTLLERWADLERPLGNLDRVALLRQALAALDPTPERRLALIDALTATGRLTAARAELEHASYATMPALQRAAAEERAKLLQRAEAAAKITPQRQAALESELELCHQELENGQVRSADQRLRAALQSQVIPEALIWHGEAQARLGKHPEALASWSRALGMVEDRGRGRIRPEFRPTGSDQGSILISKNGQHYYVGESHGNAFVWDVSKGELTNRVGSHWNAVTSLAIDDQEKVLASGSHDQTVKAWALPEGRLVHTLTGHKGAGVISVAMDARGRTLASKGANGKVILWSLPDGQLLQKWASGRITPLAMDPQGRILASNGPKEWDDAALWELPSGKLLRVLEGHTSAVTAVAIDGQGKLLATGGMDNVVMIWELPSGKLLRTLIGHTGTFVSVVAFDPPGRTLVSVSTDGWQGQLKLWELPTGKLLRTLDANLESVESVSFDPRGKVMATKSCSDTVTLWAFPSLQPLATLIAVAGGEWGVVTPDGYLDGPNRGVRWKETRCSCGMPGGPWPDFGVPDANGDVPMFYSWQLAMPRAVPQLLTRLANDDGDFRLTRLRRLLASLQKRP